MLARLLLFDVDVENILGLWVNPLAIPFNVLSKSIQKYYFSFNDVSIIVSVFIDISITFETIY